MAQIEINIDNYLSEEEKKELAIQVFKAQVKQELFKSDDGTIQSDSEIQRVIGNITHHIVMAEVQKYIPDFEEQIKSKVRKALTEKDISYEIFKVKNVWDSEESLAITYLNETVRSCKEIFQNRIKETIENYDLSKAITEEVCTVFDEMAGNFYKLSELFYKK